MVRQALDQRRPQRTLVLSGDPGALAGLGIESPCSVGIGHGPHVAWRPVRVDQGLLPFQPDVFDLVVLHDCLRQGEEHALARIRSTMPGGSTLLVLGRGWLSAGRFRAGWRRSPAWRPGWLCRRLRQMGFTPRDQRGRGLAGADLLTGQGWRRGLLVCSDRVAVRARRSDGRPDIRLVRFSTPRTVVGGNTAWDGARRESAP